MKKILLSALFMSAVSMTGFAGAQQQPMNECSFGVMIEPFSPIDPIVRRATAFIDMTQYETCGDFVAAMRNTLDPESGFPYVEGALSAVIINNARTIPLDAHLADFNIVPTDYFHILSLAQAPQPIQQEAPLQEEAVVDLLDESESESDSDSDDEDYAYGNG